ncbi:ferredoxin [Clostridium saccharoperbutylacetonicum]|uniref:4Fe-4S dicluster domain-containing protein n=1 Tax=Clostridium saccharoperbutylacetonicum N1-4(HMT) TaxID=931276 RepID=M1MQL6_9CLOT|nr:EFR1 family ferrodoxin [Clostridium saccharoperbutylacetonicum]AGF57041.1 4Fe-4S dicluster domain-containing protein [Clostridium saccharoperbutylacetonicum N1-4(HMT)]NRT62200.1 ferredoxin [Clostridium saccharoperbutylacetonicum]NSB25531.1 ferredoxin [Clostridium saccharoperbutylacetonicum]NSB44901.1 ferredoxin [Clostridium saccharoperbutylacetonicum]
MKIFYFTATGNSLDIAKRFGGELYSIPKILKGDKFDFEDEKIGIIFPCYDAAVPNIVREFIKKVTLKSPYIFVIMTYGNFTLGGINWFVKFAQENNIHIQYADKLLMIDNYLPVFDMEKEKLKSKNINENFNRLLKDINQNKHYINNGSFLDSMATSTIQSMFKIFPNFNSVKKFFVGNDCNGCGTCSKVCPRDNITISKNVDKSKPVYGQNCEFCLACINLCPQKAIKLNREKNSNARFMNENVTLKEIIAAND